MYVYLSIYILLFFLTLKEVTIRRYSKVPINIVFIFLLMLLSIIAGIRYGIGTDYYTYLTIFQGIDDFDDYQYLEPGFRLIITFVKNLGFSELSLFFIFALITLVFLFKGIKENSKFPAFSIFIFTLVFYIAYVFNGVRQGIVMSIFLYLLSDIEQRNVKKVLFFSILGMTIHYSAGFILIGYFFTYLKISRKKYIILTILCIIFMATNNFWVNLVNLVSPELVISKIVSYSDDFTDEVDLIGLLQRVLILIPFIAYFPALKKLDGRFEIIFRLYFLGFIFYTFYSNNGMFATRINMFFRILEVILFPYLLGLKINKSVKTLIFLIIIIWATLIFVSAMRNPYNFPFISIFPN